MYKYCIDIGLDISTSTVGVCVLHMDGTIATAFPVKLSKEKYKDIWDKADAFYDEIQDHLDKSFEDFENININHVFVEKAAKKFNPKKSSADTISKLCSFNGIVCYIMKFLFNTKPIMIDVNAARKTLNMKPNTKHPSKSTKQQIFDMVYEQVPGFPWETKIKKGETSYTNYNYDLADAYVVCRAGQIDYNRIALP